MNILYVTPSYKPAYNLGGPIISVSSAAERLVQRGHKVVVYTTNSDGVGNLDVPVNVSVMVDGVEVWYFQYIEPLKKLFPFWDYFSQSMGYRYIQNFSRILRSRMDKFDLVHTHAVWAYTTLVAGKVAIQNRKPLFYHQRGEFHPERLKYRSLKKRLYLKYFIRPIVSQATMLIALNKAEENNYQALGFKRPCRIIPNGIETTQYYQETINNDFGNIPIEPHNFVILFMSRMHPFKGADFLVNVFLQIAHQFPDAILIMAGPDEHGLTSDLIKKIQIAGLEGRVFFPGMVSGQHKKNLLARANLFCLPSKGEGFSMAILEALASATPVVISPGCNFPEVSSCGAGVVIDKNITIWARNLTDLMKRPKHLHLMGNNAVKLVSKYYTWDKVIDMLETAYLDGISQFEE